MKHWQYEIDISSEIRKYEAGDLKVVDVAQALAAGLKKIDNPDIKEMLEDIIDDLDYCDSADDFNYLLDEIYDIGDLNKNIWIKTF